MDDEGPRDSSRGSGKEDRYGNGGETEDLGMPRDRRHSSSGSGEGTSETWDHTLMGVLVTQKPIAFQMAIRMPRQTMEVVLSITIRPRGTRMIL